VPAGAATPSTLFGSSMSHDYLDVDLVIEMASSPGW
jgi:hypothetical protein